MNRLAEILERFIALMDRQIYGNTLRAWVFALSLGVLLYFFFKVVRAVVQKRWLPLLSGKGRFEWDRALDHVLRTTRAWFLLLLALYIASRFLVLRPLIVELIQKVVALGFLVQFAVWANFLIDFIVAGYARGAFNGDVEKTASLKAVGGLGKLIVWMALLIFALDNMGVNVTTLVAGLGVGGVAVGLAAQRILGDLFASLTIAFDKPFVQGDFITVGTDMGTIERVGLKTTRVRSLTGEELAFPNADLLQSRIRNFRRMSERRVVLNFGVTYGTPADKLEAIPPLVKELVTAQKLTRFDRAHFKGFGDSSLNFEAVYWITHPDLATSMDIQQAINLSLIRRFEAMKVEFAFPTRTVHLVQ